MAIWFPLNSTDQNSLPHFVIRSAQENAAESPFLRLNPTKLNFVHSLSSEPENYNPELLYE
jgi:hypothetical protein